MAKLVIFRGFLTIILPYNKQPDWILLILKQIAAAST